VEARLRTIGGKRYRLLGVYPRPVAKTYDVILREAGIPAHLDDVLPETRPYAGLEPMGLEVYLWVPEEMHGRARELVGDAGA